MTPTDTNKPWTAGPWYIKPNELIDGDWLVTTNHPDPEMRSIIEICNASEADALVMVAAPDMAEALADEDEWLSAIIATTACQTTLIGARYRQAVIRAALQKARGGES